MKDFHFHCHWNFVGAHGLNESAHCIKYEAFLLRNKAPTPQNGQTHSNNLSATATGYATKPTLTKNLIVMDELDNFKQLFRK